MAKAPTSGMKAYRAMHAVKCHIGLGLHIKRHYRKVPDDQELTACNDNTIELRTNFEYN